MMMTASKTRLCQLLKQRDPKTEKSFLQRDHHIQTAIKIMKHFLPNQISSEKRREIQNFLN